MPQTPDINTKILESISTQNSKQIEILSGIRKALLSGPSAEDVAESKRAKKTGGDDMSGGTTVNADAKKKFGGMLGTFLKIGLAVIIIPFLALIGGVAGVIKGIMSAPEVKFMLGILRTIGQSTLGFIKFMGSIGKWILNLGPGGKLGTGLSKVFGNIGTKMSGMFTGWTSKIASILENPKVVAVMNNVAKFMRPFTRIAFWLVSAVEFFKGWGKADEVFGKSEGDATIVEKFASGIGSIIDFMTFGLLGAEKAAKGLKATFDLFALAITDPIKAWKQITDWWTTFSFDESVVQPMLVMFNKFPETIRTFIDGPLSTFGSKAVDMLKTFIFGSDDPDSTEGSGGLWGGVKSLFSAKNVVAAITGLVSLTAGFSKMLISIASIPFIGTKGEWGSLSTWGGILGSVVQLFTKTEQSDLKDIGATADSILVSIGTWIGDIFSGLFKSTMDFLKKKFGKLDPRTWFKSKDEAPKESLDYMQLKTPPHNTFRMAKGQTRESSFKGLKSSAKSDLNLLGGMFDGGVRVTSGYRDPNRGDDAMLKSKDGLSKYKSEHTKGLTPEELNAGAGTEARKRGIEKMRAGGFSSEHEHGNAIDFSYPDGYNSKSFPALKKKILDKFPGANLIKESDHLHMAFPKTTGSSIRANAGSPSSTGDQLTQLSGQGTGSTQPPITIVNAPSNNTNTSNTNAIIGQNVRGKPQSVWYDPHSWAG